MKSFQENLDKKCINLWREYGYRDSNFPVGLSRLPNAANNSSVTSASAVVAEAISDAYTNKVNPELINKTLKIVYEHRASEVEKGGKAKNLNLEMISGLLEADNIPQEQLTIILSGLILGDAPTS
jgi:hypothetical protein